MKKFLTLAVALLPCLNAMASAEQERAAMARQIIVQNDGELRTAVRAARPGTTILVAPGTYLNLLVDGGLNGTEALPIRIQALKPNDPPVFDAGKHGKKMGIYMNSVSHVILQNLVVIGARENGIFFADPERSRSRDDREIREKGESACHHIVLDNVRVRNTGPKGNYDALKISSVDYFIVRNCHFEAWGGSGIDNYGCRYGIIENNTFIGREGYSHVMGINSKGYSDSVLIQKNFFLNAAEDQVINIGGPHDRGPGAYECRNVEVAGNIIVGGGAPVGWLGADGGHFHHNTIVDPGKWMMRIHFRMEYGGGEFNNNLIVFDSRKMRPRPITVGVQPESVLGKFRFHGNAWYDVSDKPFKPSFLPTPERDGVYGVDPRLDPTISPAMKKRSADRRLRGIGADAYVTTVSTSSKEGWYKEMSRCTQTVR